MKKHLMNKKFNDYPQILSRSLTGRFADNH